MRNRSAMVEYSSTITEQLLTTPRGKKTSAYFLLSVSLGVAFEMASPSSRLSPMLMLRFCR